jgi:signal transduction histidine kinase
MYVTNIALYLSITIGWVVWVTMIKSRRLSEQLRVARLRSAHMEDLELSAAGLAHETKNPLGIIAGIAHQVSRDSTTSSRNRMKLEHIIDEVENATERLGHFLKFAGRQTADISPLDAAEIINKISAVLQTEFKAAGVELSTHPPRLRILADENMLRQILVNLLMNSLQASKKGDVVTVAVKQSGKRAELIVTDRGAGIPPELLPKVCKPYITGHYKGHGLGLAIVKRYVDEHGWTLMLSSEKDRGTTVTIRGIVVSET